MKAFNKLEICSDIVDKLYMQRKHQKETNRQLQ